MDKPSLESLINKADSKYTLVVMAARRARQIVENKEFQKEGIPTNKPVSIALHEISQGKISYRRRQKAL